MFREIAILGPGLLGGSIALALRGRGNVRLWGRRAEVIEPIRASGMAQVVSTDLQTVITGADLVILCTPVETMPTLAEQILPWLDPLAVITDVGSVKEKVLREVAPIFSSKGHFIGSHPMAGSDQSGWEAARADLFTRANCILTPEPGTDSVTLQRLSEFWQSLGCRMIEMSAAEHDRRVGLASHLPHLTAAALMNVLPDEVLDVAGQGLRDTTRVAAGPTAMWTGILLANREHLRSGIQDLIARLQEAETLLAAEDEAGLRMFLTTAKAMRDSLREKK